MVTLSLIVGVVGISVATIMRSNPARCIGGDSLEYLELARGIAEQSTFGSLVDYSSPELYRTPAYPAFLTLVQPWKSTSRFRIALLAQLILLWLSAALVVHTLIRQRVASPVRFVAGNRSFLGAFQPHPA